MLIYIPFFIEDRCFELLQMAEKGRTVKITKAFFERMDITPESLEIRLRLLERDRLIRKIFDRNILIGYKITTKGINLLAEGLREVRPNERQK